MISDSVELRETQDCFLHILLIGTNVWLQKMHNAPFNVDFWFFKISCKIGVLKQSQSALFGSVSHMTIYIVCNHMCDECKRSNEIIVWHKLWSIFWSIVQVCSLTIEYQVVQYVPGISISEQFESILLTFYPTDFNSSSLQWLSSMHGIDSL